MSSEDATESTSEVNEIDLQLNKIRIEDQLEKYYYPRPTLPDMFLEERNNLRQNQYSVNAIYEWNIDGLTEYQIMNLVQEIIMVNTAYRTKQNMSDHTVTQALAVGFIGLLKGWWDHYLD